MRIKQISIKNLRSVKDATVAMDDLTALVGPNGSGKSTILRALDLFDRGKPVTEEDYYNRDTDHDIEIKLTFTGLPASAGELFSKYVRNNALDVVRIIHWEDGRVASALHGYSLRNLDFGGVLGAPNATAARDQYEHLAANPKYRGFPRWPGLAKAKAHLQEWERRNPGECGVHSDDGKFFGYDAVGAGYLGRYVRFIHVPAVRDAAADGGDGRGSALGDLLDLTVKKALAERAGYQSMQGEIKSLYDKNMGGGGLPELDALKSEMSRTLGSLARGAEVDLDWIVPEPSVSMPRAAARLVEDGYPSPVAAAGHGLQRAFILAVLHHLSMAQAGDGAAGGGRVDGLPSFVLSIEEPELYQHPARMRHLAGLLRSLSDGGIPGVAGQMQVVYTTHSPHFVFADRIGQIRLVGKERPAGGGPMATAVTGTTAGAVRALLERCGASKRSVEVFEHKILQAMDPAVSEGFFADAVVLVEGPADQAAICAAADMQGRSLDAMGVSVVPCGGKENIPKLLAVFGALGVPHYVVWDADGGGGNGPRGANSQILSLLRYGGDDWRGRIEDTFACLKGNIEEALEADLKSASGAGADPYVALVDECRAEHGHALERGKPLAIKLMMGMIKEKGIRLATFESIVERIARLPAGRVPAPASAPRDPLHKSGRLPAMGALLYPMLEACSGGGALAYAELERRLSDWLGLSAEQRRELAKGGRHTRLETKARRAANELNKAGLIDKERRGRLAYYTITQEGEEMVADPSITRLTRAHLEKNCPPYREWVKGWASARGGAGAPRRQRP